MSTRTVPMQRKASPSPVQLAPEWLVARLAEVLPAEAPHRAHRWTAEAHARGLVLSSATN